MSTPDKPPGSPDSRQGRVLVFVVAYEAERHLTSVFQRVPVELLNSARVEFLVIDDASRDAGARGLSDWLQQHDVRNVTVLRNPVNQGYGGNQKLGYRIAIDGGFDYVILLHGDGQYAPELLPKFIKVFDQEHADVVLGSRLIHPSHARQGGMPRYKLLGNRILTKFQNFMTGQSLSEYHTGYRGYSTAFLRKVPFETNTNDFHFDTDILLQAVYVQARIHEFAIPTHYGDEICRVNGMRYAKNVALTTMQFKMHQWGMLCSLKFRDLTPVRYEDKTSQMYSSHAVALKLVEAQRPRTLLDIGCGPGFIARQCQALGVEVTGLDVHEPMPGSMAHFHRINLESNQFPVDPFAYDAVLLLDVLEHLADPERFLIDLRNRSDALVPMTVDPEDASTRSHTRTFSPRLIISTPNVAFAAMRFNLLLGRFNYAERGILDISHKRLFTRRSLLRCLRDSGYVVEKVDKAAVPFEAVMGGNAGKLLGRLAGLLASAWPTMFAFQFVVVCRPLPGTRQLLASSERLLVPGTPAMKAVGFDSPT